MADETPELPDPLTIDPATIESAVLRRLIAEVQADLATPPDPTAPPMAYDRYHKRYNRVPPRGTPTYNRVHNRHNRGL